MLGISLFRSAGPTEFVVKYVNGKKRKDGNGLATFVGPRTNIALIPTDIQQVPFSFDELTSDDQRVVINGQLEALFDVERALGMYDFTVDVEGGNYRKDCLRQAHDAVRNILRRLVRKRINGYTLKESLSGAAKLQEELRDDLAGAAGEFENAALNSQNVFVSGITPEEQDLLRAIEAPEREKMLSAADRAIADRRKEAAEDERNIQEYELETSQKLEEQRAELIKLENANKISEADADAEAIGKRLAPYKEADPAVLTALAFTEMGKGNVGEINITPELLSVMSGAIRREM